MEESEMMRTVKWLEYNIKNHKNSCVDKMVAMEYRHLVLRIKDVESAFADFCRTEYGDNMESADYDTLNALGLLIEDLQTMMARIAESIFSEDALRSAELGFTV